MAAPDPRQLGIPAMVRILNSSPLGPVITDRVLRRQRNRAGYHIGDDKSIDLLRYTAWLAWQRHHPTPKAEPLDYAARKEAARVRNAALSAEGRDIGAIPEVVDPERKARGRADFRVFCEDYFPATYTLPWSDDHRKVISKIELAVLRGGLFAVAMPRSCGKTSLAETACIWALVCGHQEFVCLIGSDAGHARNMLESIKVEFETNDLLLEDYPEALYPIQALERIHNRARGQLQNGTHTRIVWTADEIVLPTIEGSAASGAIIRVAGIESRIRGMKFKRPDGRAVRPSVVVLDDPQTDESARSLMQIQARMDTLNGAILNLAGPGQKLSGIMPCTVIRPGDMADQILDRHAHPVWQGERTRLVYAFPKNELLWQQYAVIRADSFRNDGNGREATEFYRQYQPAMDEGAVLAWPERYNEDELTGLQHAMNLRLQDERAFWAEYQNQPLPEETEDAEQLKGEQIRNKINGHEQGSVPIGATHLTMFIDVQAKLLYYVVVAWEENFTGYVVDYGAYPDQHLEYYTLREAQRSLQRAAPGTGVEGAIYAGLEALTADLLARKWRRDDGAEIAVERCLIDANWGQSTDTIYQFCRQSPHASILLPSHGRYVGASSKPFHEYTKKRGERVGSHWRIPNVRGKRQVRHVLIDTNYWKSFIYQRFGVAMGDAGCLSLFGINPMRHQLFAEHVTAEFSVKTTGRGRTVDEWKMKTAGVDNHWFDCLVGCGVAGAMLGCGLPEHMSAATKPRQVLKLSEIQRQKRAGQRK